MRHEGVIETPSRKDHAMKTLVRVILFGSFIILASCASGGLKGKYSAEVRDPGLVTMSKYPLTYDFRSGGKVYVSFRSNEKVGTYEVDGDKVSITIDGESVVFTRAADGSLTGPNDTKFTRQ